MTSEDTCVRCDGTGKNSGGRRCGRCGGDGRDVPPVDGSQSQSQVITMSRCPGCGRIGLASARVHTCVQGRTEWGERDYTRDVNTPTELVDFALVEGSARSHDASPALGGSQAKGSE